jgi:hypothetical protein
VTHLLARMLEDGYSGIEHISEAADVEVTL